MSSLSDPLSFIDFTDVEPEAAPAADVGLPAPTETSGLPAVQAPMPEIGALLPIAHVELTETEQECVGRYQLAHVVLGPAASSVMRCPENITEAPQTVPQLIKQLGLCPFRFKCPLLAAGKAPTGSQCPLETTYLTERFLRWCKDFGNENPYELTETERVHISGLVFDDMMEARHMAILAEEPRGVELSVKETAQNGDPIAWEKQLHKSYEALAHHRTHRTRVVTAFELTPEMQTKKKRYEGGSAGADLASVQSALAARMRKVMVVDGD